MRVVVPPGASPGDLTQVSGGVVLCDIGVDIGAPPAAWVQVVIVPADGVTPTPDAAGRYLHCLWSFARPVESVGKRRELCPNALPAGMTGTEQIKVETDPGTYWIGSKASVAFLGGTEGDAYEVSVSYVTGRDQAPAESVDLIEPPFTFRLTSFFHTEGGTFVAFPAVPQYHSRFVVVQGAVRVPLGAAFVPLDASYGNEASIPLNVPRIVVSTGIYATEGAL